MEYNTKYILRYCNRDRTPLRVEIEVKDYVGEAFIIVNEEDYLLDSEGSYVVMNIDGTYDPDRDQNPIDGTAYPFLLKFQNDVNEKRGVMRATYADMQFFENNVFNIDDLATSDETELRVKFYYNNELDWIGFVTPDFFNVAIEANPQVNLTASDRIGILKDVEYPIDDYYTDSRVTYMDILVKCLYETGLELNINAIIDFDCLQFTSVSGRDTHPLLDTYVSELRFITDEENEETMSCYDVIKSICDVFNCLFTQYKGEWWIVNKEQIEIGYGSLWTFDFEGNLQNVSTFDQKEITFNLIDTGGQRTIIPAGAKNTYLLSHGDDRLYPVNRTLKGTSLDIPGWARRAPVVSYVMTSNIPTEYNDSGSVVDYDVDSRTWFFNQACIYDIVSHDGLPSIAAIDDQGRYLVQSQPFLVPTLDRKRMSFDLTIKAVGKPNSSIMLMVGLEFTDSYYKYAGLRTESDEEGNPTGKYIFSFSKFFGDNGPYDNITSGPTNNLIVFGFEDKYKNTNLAVEQEFKISVDAAGGVNQGHLDLTTAKMFIRIYPNKTQGTSTTGYLTANMIKEIRLDFKSDNQTPTGTVFQTKLDAKYTKPTDRIEVPFGDYQTYGQNGYFYKYREDSLSIHYNADGQRLATWTTPVDMESNPVLVHSLRQLTRSYGQAHDELNIGFDIPRIDPFAKYAVKCFSDRYILVNPDDDYLQDKEGTYITSKIGKYLNSKKFVFVEGTIDYLRSHFTGKLAQVRTNDVQHQEFIYSYFEQGDIS